jgi:hypothetical protein
MAITELPPAPTSSNPTNFSNKGDALLGSFATFITQTNSTSADVDTKSTNVDTKNTNVNTKQQQAALDEASALASKNSASASASVTVTKANDCVVTTDTTIAKALEASNSELSALTSASTANNTVLNVVSNRASIRPTLLLDFAKTKFMDPRVTFTRSSVATVTDSLGVIRTVASDVPRFDHDPITGESLGLLMEESRTNLFTYSDRFDNASWGKSNSIIVPNIIIAPSGDMVASKLVASNSLSGHYVAKSVALIENTTYSFTIFLKSGEYSQARINFRDKNSSFNSAVVSLVDGSVIGTPSAGLTVTTKLLSNGWLYLVVVVQSGTGSGSPTFYIYPAVGGSDTFTGDGVSGIYIWRGGLEVGAFPTSSIETPAVFTGRSSTGTFIGSNGLIQTAASGVARYQYTPTDLTIPPYLLLESAGTNLFTYSDQFDNAYWGKVRGTINQNVIAAPDGTVTADKFVESTETGGHYLLPSSSSVVSGSAYTVSAFAKNAGRYLTLYFPSNGFGDTNVENASTFDLLNGLIYSSGTKVTTAISNVGGGWYRCVINKVATVSTTLNVPIYLSNNGTSLTSYTGDGTSGVYLWGAQLEQSDRPTTYIPTTTAQVTRAADTSTSSQVTRAADSAVMTGVNFSSWYRQDEGTMYGELAVLSLPTTGTSTALQLRSSFATGNQLTLRFGSVISGSDYLVQANNGTSVDSNSFTVSNNIFAKYAYSYKLNNFAVTKDSSTPFTDSSGLVPVSIDEFRIASNAYCGQIRKIAFYPKSLSNTELVGITQ